jgi:hypothetical protein
MVISVIHSAGKKVCETEVENKTKEGRILPALGPEGITNPVEGKLN